MEDMSYSYDNKEESEQNITFESLSEELELDRIDFETMLEEIRKELNFTSLHYHRLDDMIEAIDLAPCKLCTYCWNGRE